MDKVQQGVQNYLREGILARLASMYSLEYLNNQLKMHSFNPKTTVFYDQEHVKTDTLSHCTKKLQ